MNSVYNNIYLPGNNKKIVSLHSKNGKFILRKYIKNIIQGGSFAEDTGANVDLGLSIAANSQGILNIAPGFVFGGVLAGVAAAGILAHQMFKEKINHQKITVKSVKTELNFFEVFMKKISLAFLPHMILHKKYQKRAVQKNKEGNLVCKYHPDFIYNELEESDKPAPKVIVKNVAQLEVALKAGMDITIDSSNDKTFSHLCALLNQFNLESNVKDFGNLCPFCLQTLRGTNYAISEIKKKEKFYGISKVEKLTKEIMTVSNNQLGGEGILDTSCELLKGIDTDNHQIRGIELDPNKVTFMKENYSYEYSNIQNKNIFLNKIHEIELMQQEFKNLCLIVADQHSKIPPKDSLLGEDQLSMEEKKKFTTNEGKNWKLFFDLPENKEGFLGGFKEIFRGNDAAQREQMTKKLTQYLEQKISLCPALGRPTRPCPSPSGWGGPPVGFVLLKIFNLENYLKGKQEIKDTTKPKDMQARIRSNDNLKHIALDLHKLSMKEMTVTDFVSDLYLKDWMNNNTIDEDEDESEFLNTDILIAHKKENGEYTWKDVLCELNIEIPKSFWHTMINTGASSKIGNRLLNDKILDNKTSQLVTNLKDTNSSQYPTTNHLSNLDANYPGYTQPNSYQYNQQR